MKRMRHCKTWNNIKANMFSFKTIYCSRGWTLWWRKKNEPQKKRVLQVGVEARSSLHANKFPATIYSSNGARWCAERKIELIFRGESALRGSLSISTGLVAHGSQAKTTFILNNRIYRNKRRWKKVPIPRLYAPPRLLESSEYTD